ncbi:hypothetical protein ES703_57292 [subsurface metagenome]
MSEYAIGAGINRAGLHFSLGVSPSTGSVPDHVDPIGVGEVGIAESGQTSYPEVSSVINLGDFAVIDQALASLGKELKQPSE